MVELAVPPLRKRPEDIPALARAFLAESAARWRRPGLRLSKAADELLLAHDWPGTCASCATWSSRRPCWSRAS
ncbi:MAG: hypothetical protein U1E17_09400 [Geminicoccaceae bacterium]